MRNTGTFRSEVLSWRRTKSVSDDASSGNGAAATGCQVAERHSAAAHDHHTYIGR